MQTLVAVYLAGVLLPVLSNGLDNCTRMSGGLPCELVASQAVAASLFAIILAWGGLTICFELKDIPYQLLLHVKLHSGIGAVSKN